MPASAHPASPPRLKIGLSACFQHADPARPLFTGKTLQYVEQSIAHWLMSAGALVVMVPCPTGETARGDVTLAHYAEWLDGVVMHGGADVWPGSYGEDPLREAWMGDRNERYDWFGCCAARIDDILNYLPARLTALSYVLLGKSMADKRRAWHCWRTQAPHWDSPNAGPVMASGAGALGLALGGDAVYDGELEQRPPLGSGRPAEARDIDRAWRLVAETAVLWLIWVALLAGLFYLKGKYLA